MAGRVIASESVDPRVTLDVLTAVKRGDFSARMPTSWGGNAGRVAATLNEIIESNQRLERELAQLSKRIGREGQVKRTALSDGKRDGAWSRARDPIHGP